MATAADNTGQASGGRQLLGTLRAVVRLWFIPLFSLGVLLYAMEIWDPGYASQMPGGHKYFWGLLLVVSGIYAIRETLDLLTS